MVQQVYENTNDAKLESIALGGKRAPEVQQVIAADPELNQKVAAKIEHVEQVLDNAASATVQEQKMGVVQALKAYPRACAFSMLFSTAMSVCATLIHSPCSQHPH